MLYYRAFEHLFECIDFNVSTSYSVRTYIKRKILTDSMVLICLVFKISNDVKRSTSHLINCFNKSIQHREIFSQKFREKTNEKQYRIISNI